MEKRTFRFKRVMQIAIMLLAASTAFAQQFDWVRTYSGVDGGNYERNYIVASETDSDGNLYVAGMFADGASINGQSMMEDVPFSFGGNTRLGVAVVKISPDGDVVWKRILVHNNEPSTAFDMELVGDSALYVHSMLVLPVFDSRRKLYFYDRLVTTENLSSVIYSDSLGDESMTAITVFDLDGNLTENYFLQVGYKDSTGNVLLLNSMTGNEGDSVYVLTMEFRPGPFCVDGGGNIYTGHISSDYVPIRCDTCSNHFIFHTYRDDFLGEFIVMVNGRQRFSYQPDGHPYHSDFRIMKFGPHFSSMKACRYLLGSETEGYSYTESMKMMTGETGNHLFVNVVLQERGHHIDMNITCDTCRDFRLHSWMQGMVVDCDSMLRPQIVYQIKDEGDGTILTGRATPFCNVKVDADSGYLFLLGAVAKNGDSSTASIFGHPIDIGPRDCRTFFTKFRIGDTNVLAEAHTRTDGVTDRNEGFAVGNGRVYATLNYRKNLYVRDTVYERSGDGYWGAGVMQWSYDGDEIGFIDFGNDHGTSFLVRSQLALHDSILYISGGQSAPVQMGDTLVYPRGNTIAFMARYADVGFTTPYVPPLGMGRGVPLADPALRLYPNPANGLVRYEGAPGEALRCHAISATGVRRPLAVQGGIIDLSPLSPGIYIIELATLSGTWRGKVLIV